MHARTPCDAHSHLLIKNNQNAKRNQADDTPWGKTPCVCVCVCVGVHWKKNSIQVYSYNFACWIALD